MKSVDRKKVDSFKLWCYRRVHAASGVTAVGRGHSAPPPDAAQRENRPYRLGKTRGSEREKGGGKGKKGRKERRKRKGKMRRKEKRGGKEKKERKEKGMKGRGKERKLVFPKYQVNKINQNYNNAVYKCVKSDEFWRG